MPEHLNNHHRETLREIFDGFAPEGGGATEDERDRDNGDSRWGKPT